MSRCSERSARTLPRALFGIYGATLPSTPGSYDPPVALFASLVSEAYSDNLAPRSRRPRRKIYSRTATCNSSRPREAKCFLLSYIHSTFHICDVKLYVRAFLSIGAQCESMLFASWIARKIQRELRRRGHDGEVMIVNPQERNTRLRKPRREFQPWARFTFEPRFLSSLYVHLFNVARSTFSRPRVQI